MEKYRTFTIFIPDFPKVILQLEKFTPKIHLDHNIITKLIEHYIIQLKLNL